jgi:hypothetical protein
MNYERFVIYCFHIEICHVYNITNERLIENKASIINYDSQQRSNETITWENVTVSKGSLLTKGNSVTCIVKAFFCYEKRKSRVQMKRQ